MNKLDFLSADVVKVRDSGPAKSFTVVPAEGLSDRLPEKMRSIAAKINDEDLAEELETLADEAELDVSESGGFAVRDDDPRRQEGSTKIQNEMEACIETLVRELGWLIDDEELPNNDWDAPRKKTKASRRLRKLLREHVHSSYLPGCTPWMQEEEYGDKNA